VWEKNETYQRFSERLPPPRLLPEEFESLDVEKKKQMLMEVVLGQLDDAERIYLQYEVWLELTFGFAGIVCERSSFRN